MQRFHLFFCLELTHINKLRVGQFPQRPDRITSLVRVAVSFAVRLAQAFDHAAAAHFYTEYSIKSFYTVFSIKMNDGYCLPTSLTTEHR